MNGNRRLAWETEQRRLAPATVTAGVQALLNDASKGIYFVAEADGQLAGQLLITREWSDWRNGDFWWIQSVYVLEPFRSQGIFRALFEHVQALARARQDVCGLRLYVEASNARAQAAYRHLGMNKTDYEMFETDFSLSRRLKRHPPAAEPGRPARRIKRPSVARPLNISKASAPANAGSGRRDARPLRQAGRPPPRVFKNALKS